MLAHSYSAPTYWNNKQVNHELGLQGMFVAIEGLDGAGTSTQTTLLAKRLKNDGHDVIATKEPTNGLWGAKIRGVLKGEWETHPLSLCFGFMADRVQHMQYLRKLSTSYNYPIILTDRYQLSYLAYQQKDTNQDLEWLLITQQGLPWPDVTIFVDVKPVTCIERMKLSRITAERYEHLDILEKIDEGYKSAIHLLAQRGQNIHVLNGNRPVLEIHEDIFEIIANYFSHNGNRS